MALHVLGRSFRVINSQNLSLEHVGYCQLCSSIIAHILEPLIHINTDIAHKELISSFRHDSIFQARNDKLPLHCSVNHHTRQWQSHKGWHN